MAYYRDLASLHLKHKIDFEEDGGEEADSIEQNSDAESVMDVDFGAEVWPGRLRSTKSWRGGVGERSKCRLGILPPKKKRHTVSSVADQLQQLKMCETKSMDGAKVAEDQIRSISILPGFFDGVKSSRLPGVASSLMDDSNGISNLHQRTLETIRPSQYAGALVLYQPVTPREEVVERQTDKDENEMCD